jgi:hypothetical protein
VATLLILAMLVVLLVGAFSTSNTELAASRSHFNEYRATLALESAFEAATRSAFHQVENRDDYIVFRSQTRGNQPSHLRPVVYYTAVYTPGQGWRYQPLMSGARRDISSNSLTRQPVAGNLKKVLFPPSPAPNADDSDNPAEGGGRDNVEGFPYLGPGATGPDGWSDTPMAAWKHLDFRPKAKQDADPTTVEDPDAISNAPELSTNPSDLRVKGQDLRVRYCYWIEDLAGKLDGDIAGNMDGATNGTHLRGQPAKPKDLPRQLSLFTLLPGVGTPGQTFPNVDAPTPDGMSALEAPLDNKLIGKRQYLLTGLSASQLGLEGPAEKMIKRHLVFGMPAWQEEERIPSRPGIDAEMHGQRRLALNEQLKLAEADLTNGPGGPRDEAVKTIAEHIKSCLPNFATKRAGGNLHNPALASVYDNRPLTADEYVYSLAANIIDYADRDLTPSVAPDWIRSTDTVPVYLAGQTGSRKVAWNDGDAKVPRYRGIDGQPFVCGYTTRYYYNSFQNNPGRARVSVSTWVSLWNPTNREITGNVSMRLTEGRTAAKQGNQPRVPHMNLPDRTIILRPNEFNHVGWYDHNQIEIVAGTTAPSVIGIDDSPDYAWFQSGFQLFWNGKLADATRRPDNINRIHGRTASKGGWLYLSAGLGDSTSGLPDAAILHPIFDPRGGLYTAGRKRASESSWPQMTGAYFREPNNHSQHQFWGGGAIRSAFGDRVQPSGLLADPGHKFQEYGQYAHAPSEGRTPDEEPKHTNPPEEEKAPAQIKHPVDDYPPGYDGPGYYESLGELGHIFDPGVWVNAATTGSSSISASFQGGGRTLAIGTPEHRHLDTDGVRASHLLHIFSLDKERPRKGLININSVSHEVARTLVAGLELDDDPAIITNQPGSKLFPPSASPTNAGSAFADLVAGKPAVHAPVFSTESDLQSLEISANKPFFGNPEAWPTTQSPRPKRTNELTGAQAQPSSMDDAGREELFRKVLPFVTFTSRTFRMYLTAQVLDKSGAPVATKSRVYHIFLNPVRDGAGKVIKQNYEVFYAKDL